MREAKGDMMSAAGRQLARLSLQRQLVTMSCESSLRKPHMGLGSAQLEALKRVVQRQQLPLHLVDEVRLSRKKRGSSQQPHKNFINAL